MKVLAIAAVMVLASGCFGTGAATPASSRSASLVTVPKPQGSVQDQVNQLYQAGLKIRIPKPWQANSFSGEVINLLTPRQGTRVPPGTDATVQIAGIPAQQWWIPGRHAMPKLIGDQLEHAQLVLHDSDIPWQVAAAPLPATRTRDILRSYCVVAQDPGAGRTVVITDHLVWVNLTAAPCTGHGNVPPTAQ